MNLKSFFIGIIFTTILNSFCQAQHKIDSIKKYLFGDWVVQSQHGGGSIISFDTTQHTLKIKNRRDPVSIHLYEIKEDSIFVSEKDIITKYRITHIDYNQLDIEIQTFPMVISRYRRIQH